VKQIHFIAADPYACGHYRCTLPALTLANSDRYSATSYFGPEIKLEIVQNAQILVLQRQADPAFHEVVKMSHSFGNKVLFDLDDNLWCIPSYNYAHKFYNRQILKAMSDLMSVCDGIVTSTKPLGDFLSRWNKNIHVIRNRISFPTVPHPPKTNDTIKIGWAGSPTHVGDFDSKCLHALKEIKKKYNNVEFVFMGYCPPELQAVSTMADICDVKDYVNVVTSYNWDIGIAPLLDNFFNVCKSNLKWMEYAACNMPTVASPVYPYKNSIVHGETGFFATKSTEWFQYLSLLVENEQERRRIANNALDIIRRDFSYENVSDYADEWDVACASVGM
jgi:hypothetical protein